MLLRAFHPIKLFYRTSMFETAVHQLPFTKMLDKPMVISFGIFKVVQSFKTTVEEVSLSMICIRRTSGVFFLSKT